MFAFDDEAADLERRQTEVSARIAKLRDELAEAPIKDEQALAAWQLAGAKGERPAPRKVDLERQMAEAQADFDSFTAAVAMVFEDKAAFVAKHRDKLVKDADRRLKAAHARHMGAIDALVQAREDTVTLRVEAIWCLLFPSEALSVPLESRLIAGGLREPVEKAFGIRHQVTFAAVFDALRMDADWLLEGGTAQQLVEIAGQNHRMPPDMIWDASPEGQEQLRADREKAREWYKAERARTRPEWVN